jgi:hypothetical protein
VNAKIPPKWLYARRSPVGQLDRVSALGDQPTSVRPARVNAIKRMIAAYPGLRHSAPAASGETKDRYALFDTSLKNGEYSLRQLACH